MGISATAAQSANVVGATTRRLVNQISQNIKPAELTAQTWRVIKFSPLYEEMASMKALLKADNYRFAKFVGVQASIFMVAASGLALDEYRRQRGRLAGLTEESGTLSRSERSYDLVYSTDKYEVELEMRQAVLEGIDRGIKLAQKRFGPSGINQVVIGDETGLAVRKVAGKQAKLDQGTRMDQKMRAQLYRRLKPLHLGLALADAPAYPEYFLPEKDKASIHLDYLVGDAAEDLAEDMGGYDRYAEYVATRVALESKADPKKMRGVLKRARIKWAVDALARRMVAPDYKGPRNGYDLFYRVAEYQAGRVAEKTNLKQLDVLAEQIGLS
jgi:hypothetical protein